jgi:hypothetical protein
MNFFLHPFETSQNTTMTSTFKRESKKERETGAKEREREAKQKETITEWRKETRSKVSRKKAVKDELLPFIVSRLHKTQ